VIVDRFKTGSMFCNPENAPPQRTIDQDLSQCGE
jgi:hypothetical protein